MRKFRYILIFVVFFFCAYLNVFAGICEGKTKYKSGYCKLDIAYNYKKGKESESYINRYFADSAKSIKGHLGYGYEAISGTLSGKTEYAFCLDPGKNEPTSYGYAREIDIKKSKYDEDVYKTYQYYVNSVGYAKNHHTYNNETKQKYIAYTDVVLRTYTAIYGYDLESQNYPYYYYSIIPNIIGETKEGLKNRVGNSIDKLYSNSSSNADLCSKTDIGLNNHATCGKSWASKSDIEGVRDYFKQVSTGNFLWKNPLTILPGVENNAEGDTVFTFKIDFKKDNYVYFGVRADEKHFDYDIGFGNAFFSFLGFTINGNSYDNSFGKVEIPKTEINANGDKNANDSIIYKLTIPKDKMAEFKGANGEVDVRIKYKTYHPMSEENIFINYINSRNTGDQSVYQRMVVFSKFFKEETVGLSTKVDDSTSCVQEGDVFKVNNVEVTLDEYIASCGCKKIDESVISQVTQDKLKETSCKSKEIVTVTSDLKKCDDSDLNKGDYQITYKEERKINDYCSLTCTEDVYIKDLVTANDNLSVKAGMYFKLSQYPKLTGKKHCVINMSNHTFDGVEIKGYNKLIERYNQIIKTLPGLYNTKEYYENAVGPDTSSDCRCGTIKHDDGTTEPVYCTYYKYDTSYNSSKYDGNLNEIVPDDSVNTTFGYCNNRNAKDSASYRATEAYNKAIEELNDLLTDLGTCTNALKNMGYNNSDFYQFNGDMNFYYEQEYANKNIGIVSNDVRPNNISDAEIIFNSKDETSGNEADYISSTIGYYSHIQDSGEPYIKDIADGQKLNYERWVQYDYSDSRSNVYKYVDAYTGNISSEQVYLKNPIELGYVYDIDVTAKSKKDNINYYQFISLGDNNKIYNYFNSNGVVEFEGIKRVSTIDDLSRKCTYEINNEMFKDPHDPNENSKINIVYRVVEPSDLDPNNRLGSDGFWNWDNTLGSVVKAKIEQDDTYNPKNIEYSFSLDAIDLQKIREDYKEDGYSDFDLHCTDGERCQSDFVGQYAKITEGRNKWKDVEVSNDGSVKVDGDKVNNVTIK